MLATKSAVSNNLGATSKEQYLWAGKERLRVHGFGEVGICLKTPLGGKQLLRHCISWTLRRPHKAEAYRWHPQLAHPVPGALERLVNSTQGARIKGVTTAECDSCAKGKNAPTN